MEVRPPNTMSEKVERKIILGSASANRRKVFEQMGYSFEVMSADIDEKAIRSPNMRKLPLLIARAKADALLSRIAEPAILLTADQITLWNGEMREKPKDTEEAYRFLRTMSESGLPSYSLNGIVVRDTVTGRQEEGSDASYLIFRKIPDSIITRLVQGGEVFDWAGGYNPDHPLLSPYIERVVGEEGSILGLPVSLTRRLISAVQEHR